MAFLFLSLSSHWSVQCTFYVIEDKREDESSDDEGLPSPVTPEGPRMCG